jgi:uncharacterized membrane protein
MRELLDLCVRWIHLIAGIMWIGNSMLFNWLDRNLIVPDDAEHGMQGRIWMLHSGGFYDVVKKQLAPNEMPRVLHWFKWQSYTTWLSGISLLVIVYYTTGGAFMVDPNVRALSPNAAVAIGAGTLVCGFVAYDLIWRSPLARHEGLAITLCATLLGVAIWVLTHTLSGRAAYIHVGAMLGTIMSGNVFFHIIPSQRELVAATLAGNVGDLRLSKHAKQRSVHNNYMTFPVLVLMLSNHFPGTWGGPRSAAILVVLILTGAGVRHVLNVRFTFDDWVAALVGTLLAGVGTLAFLLFYPARPADVAAPPHDDRPVAFATVEAIVSRRCVPCHGSNPTEHGFPTPPVRFESGPQIRALAERIRTRVVVQRTMPLLNRTGMTDDERDAIERWCQNGEAPGP